MPIVIETEQGGALKRKLVERAFGLLAMAGYEFGRTPEEIDFALGELDSLMAEWEADGISLGFAFTDEQSTGDEESGIANADINGVVAGLAQAIAAANGKTLSPEANGKIARSISGLKARHASIPTMPYAANTPGGMGRRRLGVFLYEPEPQEEATGTSGLSGLIP